MGRKHVVFGKVVQGLDLLKKIEQLATAGGKPAGPVKIVDCGKTSESNTQDAVGREKGNARVVMVWLQGFCDSLSTYQTAYWAFILYVLLYDIIFSFREKEKISEGSNFYR